MPSKHSDHPIKRARLENTRKFSDVGKIRTALCSESPEDLTSALTSLRNQLTIKPQEPSILPQDDRLTLVKEWMESSIGAYDLFMLWDKATLRQSTMMALIVSLVSSILTLLSAHYNNHALGQPIIKSLLTPSRLRHLNSYIGGSNNELVLVTLKLFNVMSSFASGRDKKAVLEGFGWEIKSLPKLLNMRRKTHGETDTTDPLLRPDIRTLCVQLLLSFVDTDSPTQTKALFLEQHRDPFLAIFKGIGQDHYSFARRILEVCWGGIWSDAKLKRTLKVGLFNESTVGHIMKLYDRILAEGDDDDHIPANLAQHFFLAICTRPGTGICFKDRGWYRRETEADDIALKEHDDGKRKNGRSYNKILGNILKTLKVNEDSRQQELAIKIPSSCMERVSGSSLLQRVLSPNILFQEDKNEPELWLNTLPRKRPVVIGPSFNHLNVYRRIANTLCLSSMVCSIPTAIITRDKPSSDLQIYARQSLVAVPECCSSAESSTLFNVLEQELESLPEPKITYQLLSAGLPWRSRSQKHIMSFTPSLREECSHVSGNLPKGQKESEFTEMLASLVQESRISKAHIVETSRNPVNGYHSEPFSNALHFALPSFVSRRVT